MKPDDFSDRIRQKLESIEPEFREQDWTRMQQAMGHSTPVYRIGTRTGLMAAASVAAIMAFGGVAYQQYRTNQQLRDQVRTLNQTVSTLQQSAMTPTTQVHNAPASLAPDTVYVTRDVIRYVPVPVDRTAPAQTEPGIVSPSTERMAGRSDAGPPAEHPSANVVGRTTPSANTPTTSPYSPSNPYTTGTPATVNNRSLGNTRLSGRDRASGNYPMQPSSVRDRQGAAGRPPFTNRASNIGNNTPVDPSSSALAATSSEPPNQVAELTELSARPFVRDTAYYREGIARVNRRIRRLLGTASPTPTAIAKVISNRNEPAWKIRIGAGGSIGSQQSGGGLYGEVNLNNHWRLGIGLTALNLKGSTFLSEVEYVKQMKQDFRLRFAPGIDPRHDILNIQISGATWRVPINLSYRIGLPNGWSVVPSAGIALSISNREETRFAYLRGPRMLEPVTTVWRLPQQAMHTGMASVYVEKNWGDWAVQLGPYASTPLTNLPGRLNQQSVGAAARVFYQIDWKKKQ